MQLIRYEECNVTNSVSNQSPWTHAPTKMPGWLHLGSTDARIKIENKFQNGGLCAIWRWIEKMTHIDTEELQESSDEVSDKTEKLLTQLSIVS